MAAFPARSPGSRGALLLVAALLFLAAAPGLAAARRSKKSYKAIFSFGDSLSDAGNIIVNGTPKALTTARPPYGMTFFRKPTGRCSNGRIVVDFLGTVLCVPSTAVAATMRRIFLLLSSAPRHPFLCFRHYFWPSVEK
jgi:hypothetical protein